MPITITKDDLKTQIHINLAFYRISSDRLFAQAAGRLAKQWLTQLPEAMQKEIAIVEGIDFSQI